MSAKARLLLANPSRDCRRVMDILEGMEASEFSVVLAQMSVIAMRESRGKDWDATLAERQAELMISDCQWTLALDRFLARARGQDLPESNPQGISPSG